MTPRRARSPQRRRSIVLVGLLTALIATLAPVDSPVPLGPLEGLSGPAPAEAQTAITLGTPDACNLPWQEDPDGIDDSLCVLIQPACSEHPLHADHPLHTGPHLVPSTEFPDFCEATVLLSVDPAAYAACTALAGYVIKTFMQGGDQACRMIRPTQCTPNMHRTGVNTCQRVQRRSWSCTTGTPTNQFNQCYQQPPGYSGNHPACVTGAPSFAISSCEDYVGQDFERGSVPCAGFDTGGAARLRSATNSYWCLFDSSLLDVGCHGTGASCTVADAVCVKRASTTGGCNAMANALRCRDLQADYLAGIRTAEYVYLQGCTPCVILPFSPTPSNCPADLLTNPTLSTEGRLENTHQRRDDAGPGGRSLSTCTDPPRGQLAWESSHHTGIAIVNSPVILRVIDIPVTSRTLEFISVAISGTGDVRFTPFIGQYRREYFEYPDSTPGDPIVRAWPRFDDTITFLNAGVNEIVGARRSGTIIVNDGPCLARKRPDFRVRVEELWPDTDASDIRALFGSNALDWWTALTPAQQMSRIASRGTRLTQELRCNYGADVWCNWRPARPGYYRLVAAGAWYLDNLRSRSWRRPIQVTLINNALSTMYANRDNSCIRTPGIRSYADHDCLEHDLNTLRLTPADAGLLPDLDGLIPVGTDEWLYTAAAGPYVRCPPRDMRVHCAGGGESSNYTETEPIGILVHEVRVSTVMPDN